MTNYNITALPAFKDNYIWVIYNSSDAIVVDPGESIQVNRFLAENNLNLRAILQTHGHNDHCGGIEVLQKKYPQAVLYNNEQLMMQDGEIIELDGFSSIKIITTPGHTEEHVVFLFDDRHLFCGDTLFSMGCGRVFTGDYAAMCNSLGKLKKLDPQILCYPAHEYTANNLRFTMSVDPNRAYYQDLGNYVLMQLTTNKMSLPVPLEQELKYNLFLRCDNPLLREVIGGVTKTQISNELDCFTQIRKLRNEFK